MSEHRQGATAEPPLISVRRIGDISVAIVHCGLIHWTPSGFAEEHDWSRDAVIDDEGRNVLGINWAVIRLAETVVLIDPNSFGPDFAMGVATLDRGPQIEPVLEALGIEPGAVSQVLITHGHPDHFTALVATDDPTRPRFPNATHFFPAADVPADDAEGRGPEEVRRFLGPVREAGSLQLVEGDLDVGNGLTLMSSPGESGGHQVVRLDTPSGRFYYLGDLVHLPAEVDNIDWVAVRGRDLEGLVRSRTRIFEDMQEKASTCVFTHATFPAWGFIEPAGAGAWTWRYE